MRPEVNREPDAPGQGIAARRGFWHLSAVSADCNRRFDELPPATAQRAML